MALRRAASKPPRQRRLPTTAAATPQVRQYASLPIGAASARPKTTKPQGHTAKDPSAPAKSPPSARLAAESPREIAGPTGRRRRCANAASEAPVPHQRVPRRTLASQPPRGRRDSDRSIARKTRLELVDASKSERRSQRTRTHYSKTRPPQHHTIARNQSRPACTRSSPSKSSKPIQCMRGA